jgi:hypothetical protein
VVQALEIAPVTCGLCKEVLQGRQAVKAHFEVCPAIDRPQTCKKCSAIVRNEKHECVEFLRGEIEAIQSVITENKLCENAVQLKNDRLLKQQILNTIFAVDDLQLSNGKFNLETTTILPGLTMDNNKRELVYRRGDILYTLACTSSSPHLIVNKDKVLE